MIGEWFPAKQTGIAQGIYGGWGNFGSAGGALILPSLALWYGGDDGWRWAIASTGVLTAIYSVVYFFSVTDTPKGSTYFKPKKSGALEVTSVGDLILYLLMNIPLYAALAVLTWKLGPDNLGMLGSAVSYLFYASLLGLYLFQTARILQINKMLFREAVPELECYS